MKRFKLAPVLLGTLVAAALVTAQENPLVIGPNINMVSGTEWPAGDPFLRQQNEPSVAFSSRNKLHILSGANDYRTVDIPGDFEAGATGDSWLSYFWSTNGGGTWKSNLIPGYPQDDSPEGMASPLKGYAAGADPVVRAGTHGLFYFSGIAFERTENPGSAIFVSRFIDLNNDEGGDPIRFIDTMLVDTDTTGDRFLDKSWIGVDIPRPGATTKTFNVTQRDGTTVSQTVECGNVYVAYAALTGDGETLRSEIMLTRSTDCGDSWSIPEPISEPDTLNQGANIAIDPLTGDVHIGWRRFDTVEAFLGTPAVSCSKKLNEWKRKKKKKKAVEWPVDEIDIGDLRLTREEALDLLSQDGDDDDDDGGIKLAKYTVAGKLNLLAGGGQASDTFDPVEWTRTLSGLLDEADAFFEAYPLEKYSGSFNKSGKSKKSGKSDKSDKSGKSKKSGKSDKSDKSGKSGKSNKHVASTWYEGPDLDDSEEKLAKNLRKDIKNNYLGSPDCVAAAGTEDFETGSSNAMVAAKSSNGGASFDAPVTVAEITTFDQGGSNFSFRTTAYPSLAVDAFGRVYMAFAARGFGTVRPDEESGDARIVLAISDDGGNNWQPPYAIDDSPTEPGHQFKPSLLFAGGKLLVLFYDLREDVSGIFERFVLDVPEPDRVRHTLDVRAATAIAIPGPATPKFTSYDVSDERNSQQASRYAFVVTGSDPNNPETVQLQYMVPNLPTHAGGTQPFIGDYVDVSAKVHIFENGLWRYATELGDVDVYQAVWTDNRDIAAPPDGDWTKYIPPNAEGQSGERVSVFDGSTIAACETPEDAKLTGTRNQNIYSALLSDGLIVAAPGNNRPLGTAEGSSELLQRSYVVFTQNVTAFERFFLLTVLPPVAGQASFDQFAPDPSVIVSVAPFSSTVRTVFAKSEIPEAVIAVKVQEVDNLGNVLGNGLTSTVFLNADPTAPLPLDGSLLEAESHNPKVLSESVLNPTVLNPTVLNPTVLNPTVFNPTVLNPTVLNPTVFNPTVFNPTVFNPTVFNPTVLNPTVFNPTVLNPTVLNPTVFNPTVFNPTVLNPTVLNPTVFNPTVLNPTVLNPTVLNTAVDSDQRSAEVTFTVQNDGSATSSYDINLASQQGKDDGLSYQVIVYRLNKTPVAEGCDLAEEAQQELIANVIEPTNDLDPLGGDGTTSFYIEPGEEVFVTVKILPDTNSPNPGDPGELDDNNLDLSIGIEPQAIATEDLGDPDPQPDTAGAATAAVPPVFISSTALPNGTACESYSAALSGGGGIAPLSWDEAPGTNLPEGLSVASNGVVSGTPIEFGMFNVSVTATDGYQIAGADIDLDILPDPITISGLDLPDGTVGQAYAATALTANNDSGVNQRCGVYEWSLVSGSLPPGLDLSSSGVISGIPTDGGDYSFIVEVTDGVHTEDAELTISVVQVFVAGGSGGNPWTLDCPTGHVGIGLRGNAGDDIDATELVCAEVDEVINGFPTLGTEVSAGFSPDSGGAGSSYGNALMCGPGEVLSGLQVRAGNVGFGFIVDQLGVRCQNVSGSITNSALQGTNESGASVLNLSCGPDNFVLGLTGRSDAVMDQIGVVCGAAATDFDAATLESRYYVVAESNDGYTPRDGQVLDFDQGSQTGTIYTFDVQTGNYDNQTFSWAVVDGKLEITYDSPVVSDGLEFDYNNTTATPAEIALIEAEAAAQGVPIVISFTTNTTKTVYTRVIDGLVDIIEKEDTQQIVYDPIDLSASGGSPNPLQLASTTRTQTSTDTLREESTTPAVDFTDNCGAGTGTVCVQGRWAGSYAYAPGTRYFDGYVYPATNWGESLTFTAGGGNPMSGAISAMVDPSVSSSWSVVNDRLVIDYGGGFTQTVTIVENNGIEYGAFSEYYDSVSDERYIAYDIWVKGDPAFNFTEGLLDSADGKFWVGDINSWIPGFFDEQGERSPTARFGWEFDPSTDPNSGFNRSQSLFDNDGDGDDDLVLFVRPNQWSIEPGRLKIDRFLDQELSDWDRYWYPIDDVVFQGDRQVYVMEVEYRFGGLLFPARLNIEREIDKLDDGDFDDIVLQGLTRFREEDIPARIYSVDVANPGYTSREGEILNFNQAPNTGSVLGIVDFIGDPIDQAYTWDVDAGILQVFYTNPPPDFTFQEFDINNTTATQGEIDAYNDHLSVLGLTELPIDAAVTTEVSRFTRTRLGFDFDWVDREDEVVTTYVQLDLTASGNGFLDLAPKIDFETTAVRFRDSAQLQGLEFSATCPGSGGSVCVPGDWGAIYRYQPGQSSFDGFEYPGTVHGDVLTFSGGTVTGAISGVGASWSISNGDLVIDYGDGWTQTATIVEQNAVEYGVFSEFTDGSSSYARYEIFVKVDPGFAFSDAYLQNLAGEFWQGEINTWIPGTLDANGDRVFDQRFGWELTDNPGTNTGFNRFVIVDIDGDGGDDTTLLVRPNEWTVQGNGLVKIDRYLDTRFDTFDRFWYPLASTTFNGDRQFYVMEIEYREDGLLFPARLNIEREIEKQTGYDNTLTLTPDIGSGVITDAQPDPSAAGIGQLVLVSGTDLPTTDTPRVFVTQNGQTYEGAEFAYDGSNHLVRLPLTGLVPGPAILRLGPFDDSAPTASWPIEISTTPATPVLLDARSGTAANVGASTTTLIPNGKIVLLAQGTDDFDVVAVFDKGGTDTEVTVEATELPFAIDEGLAHEFTVPGSFNELDSINVTIKVRVNGVWSAESNTIQMQVPLL